jgi:hypothetical protein
MLDIKTEFNGPGKLVHSFVARGTQYTIFQNTITDEWEVWSARQSLGSRVGSIRLFDNLTELGQANKTLANFTRHIEIESL